VERNTFGTKFQYRPATITESNGADLLESKFSLQCFGAAGYLGPSEVWVVSGYEGADVEWFACIVGVETVFSDDFATKTAGGHGDISMNAQCEGFAVLINATGET
jgi:hypothetical protein